MTNVITVLIDSVLGDSIGTGKTEHSTTPFIDSLAQDGILAKSIYSYGPYTDAASNALYTGNPTMNDFGYYYGINSSNYNHYRIFKENGYETYGLYYPYYLLSSKVTQYIDHSIYTSGFWYKAVWGGKLEYYAELLKSRELSNDEKKVVIHFLELLFDILYTFYDNVEKQECATLIIKQIREHRNDQYGKELLNIEYDKFNNDKEKYMMGVLQEGMNHPLSKINEFNPDLFAHKAYIQKNIYQKYKDFFNKLNKLNILRNCKNGTISFKKSIKYIKKYSKSGDKNDLRYLSNEWRCLNAVSEMKKRSLSPYWQYVASMQNQVSTLLNVLKDRNPDDEKPFYASLHVLEPHNDISCFTYDIENQQLSKEEILYLRPLLHEIGRKFKGNIVYQASLRYVDLCVKRLVSGLEEQGLLNNTMIVLVSDHGTSYTFNPIRDKVVNTFYYENYMIPLVIWKKDMDSSIKGQYKSKYMSDDVFPTIFDILGIDTDGRMKGNSILKNHSQRKYTSIEYMGPGCPDLFTKEMWIGLRSENYLIAYKNRISEVLDKYHPCELYNLVLDPLQENNIAAELSSEMNPEINEMIEIINNRFEEIKAESQQIIKDIENYKVTSN